MAQPNNPEKQIEKQMGCMSGFLQIFYTSSTVADVAGSEFLGTASSDVSKEVSKVQTPKRAVSSPKYTKPSPVYDLKEGTKSSWKLKETSRLSLDSRASYDDKGNIQMKETRADRLILQSNPTEEDNDNQKARSSTSVIARLMGLEPITQVEQVKPAELQRCSSESRFPRDLLNQRFIVENDNSVSVTRTKSNATAERVERVPKNGGESKRLNRVVMKSQKQRRSFFETEEVFPEAPQKQSISVSGEIEKRLKMRGIDEVTKDIDRLKEILEAWQLKGLLHSKSHEDEQHVNYKNIVHYRMDPESPSYSRGSPRRRNVRSPIRTRGLSFTEGSEVKERRSTIVKQKMLTVETRVNGSAEKSPRGSPRKTGLNQVVATVSPRSRKKGTAEIYQKEKIRAVVVPDELSSVCGSSLSTTSQNEGLKVMEWKEGRSLLERCDKLVKSIGELNATEQQSQQSQQSSPVSVLDSSFYESAVSPSPIMKRTIHFKENSDVEEEEESRLLLSNKSDLLGAAADDSDLVYITEILRTWSCFPGDYDIFTLLEKQQRLKGKDTSNKASRLQRKLIFDIINEMLVRHRRLPPWKALSQLPLGKIWSEFRRIRGYDDDRGDDLVTTVCSVVRKDLAGDEWGECSVELSAVVLDIERMIFRDLVTESIGDLATLACPIESWWSLVGN